MAHDLFYMIRQNALVRPFGQPRLNPRGIYRVPAQIMPSQGHVVLGGKGGCGIGIREIIAVRFGMNAVPFQFALVNQDIRFTRDCLRKGIVLQTRAVNGAPIEEAALTGARLQGGIAVICARGRMEQARRCAAKKGAP